MRAGLNERDVLNIPSSPWRRSKGYKSCAYAQHFASFTHFVIFKQNHCLPSSSLLSHFLSLCPFSLLTLSSHKISLFLTHCIIHFLSPCFPPFFFLFLLSSFRTTCVFLTHYVSHFLAFVHYFLAFYICLIWPSLGD